ncbi:hypothetical protein SAMD00019534_038390 [Acytostelium subglobosum LB1]|uniref:hypothetical protein n=1 Tax=Acytostelium subglobosum LB1 TaxID=1410327 RepID=UPI000644DCF0|nr:hypothetical protein SAMD00019534_038390 [Acytostelium subglobosum LB1]GAM20664.1 hypothetical protein SAMD00019534_038390 [Acytostelium subglobosum LB1]|eukprot:XP_012760185.1 hypothetical protein SAMD00019534_038390 [Acytostelium subglobosum LB1]
MAADDYLEMSLPVCPESSVLNQYIYNPSITIIFGSLALACFIFATIIAFKYNSVAVFHKKIRTQTISNTIWILYYLVLGLRGASNTVRFAMNRNKEEEAEKIFFIASLTLSGFTALTLALALNHQRKYRSSSSQKQQQLNKETDPLIAPNDQSGSNHLISILKRNVTLSEILFLFFFICFLVFLYVEIIKENAVFYYILLGCCILQHIPVLTLALMITFTRNGGEGPTTQSRVFLMLGALFNIFNYLPLFVWAKFLPGGCPLYVFSWVDLIQLSDFASILFFFLFLRSEYIRNVEECIWTAVSQIQDTFDFRLF